MKKIKFTLNYLFCIVFFQTIILIPVFAADSAILLEQRILKIEQALDLGGNGSSGLTLEDRVAAIEKKMTENPAADTEKEESSVPGAIGRISDRITLSGAVELDYSFANDSNPEDKTKNGSTSDLDIGTVELGLEAVLHEYVTANVVLLGEALASEDDSVTWDEVYFTIQKEGMPVYFTGGKRCLPFGVFESLFINDPITQELYEINDTGATIGFANEDFMGLDLSLTLYKGESLIATVAEDAYGVDDRVDEGDDVASYIISASGSPVEGLTLSAFYNSEPGHSDRNDTLGGAVHFEMMDFILDAEYITAMSREELLGDNEEHKENTWAVSLGYQVIDPLILAIRYEGFDADMENEDGNLDKRYGIAATYTLLEDDSFACNLMGEYRRTEYETSAGSENDEDLDELFIRLALEF